MTPRGLEVWRVFKLLTTDRRMIQSEKDFCYRPVFHLYYAVIGHTGMVLLRSKSR